MSRLSPTTSHLATRLSANQTTQDHLKINLRVVDASKEFYAGLKGVTDPEKKRKFIGGAFIDAFEAEVGVKIDAFQSPRI